MATTSPGMIGDWYKQYLEKPPEMKSYTAASAGTTAWNVNKGTETIEGRLPGLLSTSNPLMEQAATKGAHTANKRGLLNSSMGVQAGQAALYDYAVPIAQNDANTYARSSEFNAGEANKASIANAGFSNDASRFNAGAVNDMNRDVFNMAGQWGLEDKRNAFSSSERQAAESFTVKRDEQAQKNTLEQMTKGLGFDLTRMSAQQVNDLAIEAVRQDGDMKQLAAQHGFNLDAMNAQAGLTLKQMDKGLQNDLIMRAKEFGYSIETMSAQQINELARMTLQQRFNLDTLGATTKANLETMSVAQQYAVLNSATAFAQDLEKMSVGQMNTMAYLAQTHSNNVAMQEMANAYADKRIPEDRQSYAYQSMINAVNAIMMDPNIDAVTVDANGKTAKDRAIQNALDAGASMARLQSTFFDDDPTNDGVTMPKTAAPGAAPAAAVPPSTSQAGGGGGQVATDGLGYVNAV